MFNGETSYGQSKKNFSLVGMWAILTVEVEIIRPVLDVMKKYQGRNFTNLDPPLSI